MKSLDGKVALVTGASRGLGPYMGRALEPTAAKPSQLTKGKVRYCSTVDRLVCSAFEGKNERTGSENALIRKNQELATKLGNQHDSQQRRGAKTASSLL